MATHSPSRLLEAEVLAERWRRRSSRLHPRPSRSACPGRMSRSLAVLSDCHKIWCGNRGQVRYPFVARRRPD